MKSTVITVLLDTTFGIFKCNKACFLQSPCKRGGQLWDSATFYLYSSLKNKILNKLNNSIYSLHLFLFMNTAKVHTKLYTSVLTC